MAEEYKELRPLNRYALAANETWLEDMAAEGYHLAGFKGMKGVFEKGEPQRCRYRMQLEARKEKEPSEERRAANEAKGWTYVTTLDQKFHIWKTDRLTAYLDPAPGLDADDFSRLRRKLVLSKLLEDLLLTGLIAVTVFWIIFRSGEPLRLTIRTNAPGFLSILALMLLLGAVTETQELMTGLRLLRTLEEGERLERPVSYRREKWLARIFSLLGILCTVSGLMSAFWDDPWDGYDRNGDPKPAAVYVDLRDLDGVTEAEFFATRTKFHELAPRMWFVRQFSGFGEEQCYVESEYYELLTALLTPQLEKELRQQYEDVVFLPVETQELDRLWVGESEGDQFAIAALGRKVLYLEYRGDADLRTQDAYFAGLMK